MMTFFSEEDILQMPKVKRLNIINSITGIKPANLISTIDERNRHNLAIFSSVVHLGSNPALIGFILRPQEKIRRHTYENILENGYYTINHLPNHKTLEGHYTSAKFDKETSEYDVCHFTPEFQHEFPVPYVKESFLKMGLKHVESIPIKYNGTVMIVGKILQVYVAKSSLSEEGYINLEEAKSVGISGLNTYYDLKKIASYPYARPHELPHFKS
ncbi:MAG: flavin reductase [Bacteroidota bacterium]|nr:flavin reductase [Bacteroidota bacterium]|tara:strand:- start:309 stop:950 length:642 start_codon:yes stop_codon:yes gene_type:complete